MNSSNLQQSIQQLYTVFSKSKPPKSILKFNCTSCITEDDEKYLLHTPLKKLNNHIFGGIMESCNVIGMGNQCYKYYIPRILELTTIANFDFNFGFVEYVYRDFSKFDYTNTFNKNEINAINDFFLAFLTNEFLKPTEERDEAEIYSIAETGYNVLPFLEKIATEKDWLEIKQQLVNHIGVQKKWADSDKEFNLWKNRGSINNVIDFIIS